MLTNISILLSITQPKNIQIETQGTVILSTVLYGFSVTAVIEKVYCSIILK